MVRDQDQWGLSYLEGPMITQMMGSEDRRW
jgi:hypothetical protein